MSGLSARRASTSLVAAKPSASMTHNPPTSFPALSADQAQQPTTPRLSLAVTARTDRFPTLPVVHCTTRYVMLRNLWRFLRRAQNVPQYHCGGGVVVVQLELVGERAHDLDAATVVVDRRDRPRAPVANAK